MTSRYRLSPGANQETVMVRHCSDARFVWNLALEQTNCWRSGRGPTPRYVEQARQLVEARRATWLGEGSSSIQQAALRDLDRATADWWAGVRRRPTWRRSGLHEGFCVRDVRVTILSRRWAEVSIPKCGRVRFRLSRPLPAEYGSARVTMDRAGRWHVSFAAPQPPVERTPAGRAVGLDRGVAVTVATSDGELLSCPTPPPAERERQVRLQRRMARQQKDSNRRARTRLRLARLAAQQADRRKDWIEKTSTDLVRRFDLIILEDLKVRNMMRSARRTIEAPGRNVRQKAGLNRSIAEAGWSMLARRIEDKAAASGVTVIKINPRYTSQRCAACGHTAPENRESQAVFECRACGHQAHADVNAAINILAAGQAVIGRGGTGAVRPPDEASTEERNAA